MPTRRGLLWSLWYLWCFFLFIVLVSSQLDGKGDFGSDNLRRLAPFAVEVGDRICDMADAIGLDFSSIQSFYDHLTIYPRGYTSFVTALVVVGTWAVATWMLTWIVNRFWGLISGRSGMEIGGPASAGATSSGGDPMGQRVLAVVIAIFLFILFSPGWPIEGPLFRLLNDQSLELIRGRQSQAIVEELARENQDWVPADLSPACQAVMTDGPNQLAARNDPAMLRTCGESVKSALEADATMGREPDPRVESSSIRFLLEISGLAKNGQLAGVDPADHQFRLFGSFARATYPSLRQEGWRQAAQRYLGLLQYPDERTNSQDARADVGYKLSVLAELLYNSGQDESHQVAYRIAAVTGSELDCVPDVLRDVVDARGTPVALPSLPSCMVVATSLGRSSGSFLGLGSLATGGLIGILMIFAIINPFLPWPSGFPYSFIYIPVALLMGVLALG